MQKCLSHSLLYDFPKIHTQSAHSKCLDKWDLPLPALSAWAALSVYSAYFPNGTVKKDSAGVWVPHIELLRHAPWHPAWETQGEIVQAPVQTSLWHPGNSYFLFAIFSIPDVCLGLKKMEGLAMQLLIVRTVKIQSIVSKTIFNWFLSLVLWKNERQQHLAPE